MHTLFEYVHIYYILYIKMKAFLWFVINYYYELSNFTIILLVTVYNNY